MTSPFSDPSFQGFPGDPGPPGPPVGFKVNTHLLINNVLINFKLMFYCLISIAG